MSTKKPVVNKKVNPLAKTTTTKPTTKKVTKKTSSPSVKKADTILKGMAVTANRFLKRHAPIELSALGGQKELTAFTDCAVKDEIGFDIYGNTSEVKSTVKYLRGYLNGLNAAKK